MLDSSKVGFDFDCTIVDSIWLYSKIAKELGYPELIHSDITTYNITKCTPISGEQLGNIISLAESEHELDYEPYENALSVLNALESSIIVSARKMIPDVWLEKNLPGAEFHPVGSNDKIKMVLNLGLDMFVDDRLETCFQLFEAGITPIVYNQPWNQDPHPFRSVNNWFEIDELLRNVMS